MHVKNLRHNSLSPSVSRESHNLRAYRSSCRGVPRQHLLAGIINYDLLVFSANEYIGTIDHMKYVVWLIMQLAGSNNRMSKVNTPECKINACSTNSVIY